MVIYSSVVEQISKQASYPPYTFYYGKLYLQPTHTAKT